MYTQEQWKQYEEMYNALYDFSYEYLAEFGERNEDFQSVSIENGYIELTTETYYSGCGSEYETHSLPVEWLSMDNWKELEKARREERRIAAEKARHQKLVDDNNKKLAIEKAKYLELHAKFGGNDDSNS